MLDSGPSGLPAKISSENFIKYLPCGLKARERICQGAGMDTRGQGLSLFSFIFHRPPSSISLQQWLKRREDPLDNQAIALSRRMNAIGLIERCRACHPIEKKRNQRQAILLR